MVESDDVMLCAVSGAVDIAAGVEAARPEAAQGEGSLPMGLVSPHSFMSLCFEEGIEVIQGIIQHLARNH